MYLRALEGEELPESYLAAQSSPRPPSLGDHPKLLDPDGRLRATGSMGGYQQRVLHSIAGIQTLTAPEAGGHGQQRDEQAGKCSRFSSFLSEALTLC